MSGPVGANYCFARAATLLSDSNWWLAAMVFTRTRGGRTRARAGRRSNKLRTISIMNRLLNAVCLAGILGMLHLLWRRRTKAERENNRTGAHCARRRRLRSSITPHKDALLDRVGRRYAPHAHTHSHTPRPLLQSGRNATSEICKGSVLRSRGPRGGPFENRCWCVRA